MGADEPNGYDKRIRELEQWAAGRAEWVKTTDHRLTDLEIDLKAINRTMSRWAGAFLVVQIIATVVGAAIAKTLIK